MTELTIQPEEIQAAFDSFVSSYEPAKSVSKGVGHVTLTADGIARVEGLPGTMANELPILEDGTLGLAIDLEKREIGVVVLGEFSSIREDQEVRYTGEVLSVSVGEGYLGRTMDPLGRLLDGLDEIQGAEDQRALELQVPDVTMRRSIHEPLQADIKAVDPMIPIGHGQRQLIIDDRQTGKTTLAINTILNQRRDWLSGNPKKQVRCIHVIIGQKGSIIASVRRTLEKIETMNYTTVITSPTPDPAGFKYLAPYTGSAAGQHWMYNGKHVLVVFGDLSKQAEAYRAVSLLLHRPPGREAYPGDVFYLYSRLLERYAKLSDEMGGGSVTGLPLIEAKANDVSAYIPTNVISIANGQILLQPDLFNADQRPAVDVRTSVPRVGGDAQIRAMKKVAGTLKITLAQYCAQAVSAVFASDLDVTARQQLTRDEHIMQLLHQQQYMPYKVEDQVASVWAGTNGFLDELPLDKVHDYGKRLLDYLRHSAGVLEEITETGLLEKETEEELRTAVKEFTYGCLVAEGVAADDEGEVEVKTGVAKKQIVRAK